MEYNYSDHCAENAIFVYSQRGEQKSSPLDTPTAEEITIQQPQNAALLSPYNGMFK